MSTTYRYNDLSILYCKTVQFVMEEEYDPAGVDGIRNKYTVRVRGFLYTAQTGEFATSNTGAVLAAVKAKLEAPRRPFTYSFGTNNIISVPSGLDAKLGPKPLPAVVTEVTSGLFAVECGVEVYTANCDSTCDRRDPVVSLRWGQTESFDQNWFARLRTKGKLIVRSDLRQCADNFRPLATPPLLPDYQRLSATYALSPDGLELDFEFDDAEFDRLPPFPATKASGNYTVEVVKPGYNRFGTATVALEGPKGSSRDLLMMRAYNMCYSILTADRLFNAERKGVAIWSGTFTQDLFVPKVSARITARMSPVQTGIGAYTSLMPSLRDSLRIPGLQVNQPGILPPERKRLLALLSAAFRDPCACVDAGAATAELRSDGSPYTTPGNPNVVFPVPKYPVVPPATLLTDVSLSTGPATVTDPAPYDTYQIETTTTFMTGTVMLPGTGVGPDANIAKAVTATGYLSYLTVSWVAGRTGEPPQLPAFIPTDTNLVALGGAIVAKDTVPAPDGTTLTFLFSGYYVYGIKDPKKWQITPPVPPFMSTEVTLEANRGATNWVNLVGAGAAIAGGGGGGGDSPAGVGGAMPFVPGGAPTGGTPSAPPGFGGVTDVPPNVFPLLIPGPIGGGAQVPGNFLEIPGVPPVYP